MSLTKEWLCEHYGVSEDDIVRRKAFLADVEALMRKHNVSISHEDGHGAFVLEDFDESNLEWLRAAHGGLYGTNDRPSSP